MPRLSLRERWVSLTSEQRFGVTVLSVTGGAALILSISFMYMNLREPFLISKSTLTKSQKILAERDAKNSELERSKSKDTDRDGLSDYAELYIYRTSPYLADTDSDAIPDAIEVAQGSNPNCPTGQNCVGLSVEILPASSVSSSYADLLAGNDILNAAAASALGADSASVKGAQEFVDNAPPPASLTPLQMRVYLVQNNLIEQERLDNLGDEDIKIVYAAVYGQALKIREARVAAATASTSTSVTSTSSE